MSVKLLKIIKFKFNLQEHLDEVRQGDVRIHRRSHSVPRDTLPERRQGQADEGVFEGEGYCVRDQGRII